VNKIYKSPISATDIGYNAFIYARWRHRLAWLLPFEWPNASILKGVLKFDAPVRRIPWTLGGGKFKLVKTTFNDKTFIHRLPQSISSDFSAIHSWTVCHSQKSPKFHKNLYFGIQSHPRSLLSM